MLTHSCAKNAVFSWERVSMQRYTLTFAPNGAAARHSLDVPDLPTALIVADINLDQGRAEIRDGQRLLATLEKQGRHTAPYWRVS